MQEHQGSLLRPQRKRSDSETQQIPISDDFVFFSTCLASTGNFFFIVTFNDNDCAKSFSRYLDWRLSVSLFLVTLEMIKCEISDPLNGALFLDLSGFLLFWQLTIIIINELNCSSASKREISLWQAALVSFFRESCSIR